MAKPAVKPFTAKELAFIVNKLAGMNGKEAAIAAGYAPNSAAVQASGMMRRGSRVLAEINSRQNAALRAAERVAKVDAVDAAWVKRNLVEVVERCLQEVKPALHPKTRTQVRDEYGNLLFTFNSAAAIAGLRAIGDLADVSAFEQKITVNLGPTLVERLQAGRHRARPMIDVTPPLISRDTTPEGNSDDE